MVAFLGSGTVLYLIGFLILRAHYDFLGVWSGALWNPSDAAEEGGRFLFMHLVLGPLGRLASLDPIAISAVCLWAFVPVFARRLLPRRLSGWQRQLSAVRFSRPGQVAAVAVVSLIVTTVLLSTVWQATRPRGLLHCTDAFSERFRDVAYRHQMYRGVVWRVLLAVAIAWGLFRYLWDRREMTVRLLIVIQWLLTVSAVVAWPMAYGKLSLSHSYPTLRQPSTPAMTHLLLLGRSEHGYFVWNSGTHEFEILPFAEKEKAVIGPQEDLDPIIREACK